MDDKFITMAERIAALEASAEHGQRDRDEMKDKLDIIHASQKHTDKNLDALVNKISKWEGKFGGVIFVISCLWIFLTNIPGAILEWLKLGGAGK